MMNTTTRTLTIALLLSSAVTACGRAETEPATNPAPGPTRVVNFAYRGGAGEFVHIASNGQPVGIELEPGESYFGALDGRVIAHKDGVLRIGDQRFPELPLESEIEVLNGEVIVNGELWGRIED